MFDIFFYFANNLYKITTRRAKIEIEMVHRILQNRENSMCHEESNMITEANKEGVVGKKCLHKM
jgi:hypothetical protein